jgi:WD40 repeat protein
MVTQVAFDPNGHWLAVASADASIQLWDVSSADRPALLDYQLTAAYSITALAFTSAGDTLIALSSDTQNPAVLLRWRVDVNQARHYVCEVARPRISTDQWQQMVPGVPYQPPCR